MEEIQIEGEATLNDIFESYDDAEAADDLVSRLCDFVTRSGRICMESGDNNG